MTIGSYPPDTTLRNFCQIIDEIETKKQDKSYFSLFQTSFSQLIEKKISLRDRVKDKKEYYSISIYNIALIKIIDIVREKTFFLNEVNLIESEKGDENQIIENLNSYYDAFLATYISLIKESQAKTIGELIKEEISTFLPFSRRQKLLSIEELKEKKKLADKGYFAGSEIEKWLKSSLSENDLDLPTLFKNQSIAFLNWAETHPRTASYLAGDIALTYSILLEDEALKGFSATLNAILTTRLFLDALGLSPEYEEVEAADFLKFRAFADLVSYCPQLATGTIMAKKAIDGQYQNILQFVFDALKKTTITQGTQKLPRLIPASHQKSVLLLVDLIRGENFTSLLTHQRNLSLIQLAGSLRAVLKNRSLFWIRLEVFWKTIFEAKGSERTKRIFTSLFLPLLATLLATFSFIFHKKNNSFLVIFNSMLLLCSSSALFWLSSFLTRLIDEETGFKTKKQVQKKLSHQQKQKENLLAIHLFESDPEMKAKIQEEVHLYIEDLKKHYVLPKSALKEGGINKSITEYSEQFQKILKKKKESLIEQLEKNYAQSKIAPTPSFLVSTFNKVLDLKKLREKLLIEDEEEIDSFIFLLSETLIDEWLKIKMEQIFKKKFIKIYQTDESEYLKKEQINLNKLKKPLNYLKKSLKSREIDQENHLIMNTLLDKLIPY